ncbi:hypothetical protein [Mycolicibacterium fortuitum]|uniref:hypothetical protein n=1 Tax=Mycolicibacterium fortuitum TaxID=1766 RepID=UPI002624CDBD|nr:hypothetical protein [Mycolicibacterium fortuitum]
MDYWTSDRPDGTPGYQFHDLGDDFEELNAHPEYFFFARMALGAHTIADQLRAARGVPAFQVTVYRAVPLGVTVVNTGDWVTPARELRGRVRRRRRHHHLRDGSGRFAVARCRQYVRVGLFSDRQSPRRRRDAPIAGGSPAVARIQDVMASASADADATGPFSVVSFLAIAGLPEAQ